MLKTFINRPVLATVVSIILVLLGILGLMKLPLQQFPEIAPPAVQVTANYPGANAETVLKAIAPSLEESINGVENMNYITSTASNDGSLTITIYFKLGTDPDQAAVNVQNRVSQAINQLPNAVVQAGITTTKIQNTEIMVLDLISDDEAKYDQTFLNNYALINIIPEIQRIHGVGKVFIYSGNREYAMRIWLNPSQMASYRLTPNEVITAIENKNLEATPGKFGEKSTEAFEFVMKYKGKLDQPIDYENIIIRSNSDGSFLRLKDVARIELGSYTYTSHNRINSKPGVNVGILQSAGTNANEVQIAIAKFIEKASQQFPEGVSYMIQYNTKETLDQSIDQVKMTLLEAFILVFFVVYVFLQDFRSTLIPAIAVPVSIVGTFFFMQLFGFSINMLTLFALILAIGIVVDDAIVVVEAVHSKMTYSQLPAKEATISAMSEITGAIISITLVMAAVFIPVGLMEGSTGVFYQQFAFTLAIAIAISAINALTLSPALCALLLKADHGVNHEKKSFKSIVFTGFNRNFTRVTRKYTNILAFLIRHKWIGFSLLGLLVVVTVLFAKKIPTGFIPSEDRGFVAVSLTLPEGASLDRTTEVLKLAEERLSDASFYFILNMHPGYNTLNNTTSSSTGAIFVSLKPYKERGPIKDINAIMDDVNKRLSPIKGANFFVFTYPTVSGFGNVDGLDFVLQDRTGGALTAFSTIGQAFIEQLKQRPEIKDAFTSFKTDFPQYELIIDDEKAGLLGVTNKDILQTMQVYFGSKQASDFNRFGKYYRVMVQADFDHRLDSSALDGIYVKNKEDAMVPVKTLVQLKRTYGPETASRYNLFNSMNINAIPAIGYTSGDAIKAVEEVAQNHLPTGFTFEFSGMTKEEMTSGGQSAFIFIVCLIFIYLLLAAQFESYIIPLAVILSIPTGIFGVFTAIGLTGISNNIYVQVALVMLIGLLAKNAILIVEFAIQARKRGYSISKSAIEAARLRLRPIIMTSLAFVAGLIPMMRATGPSAQGNHAISIAAAGGMVSGVVLGLFIIPILYVVFQYMQERIPHFKPHFFVFKKWRINHTSSSDKM